MSKSDRDNDFFDYSEDEDKYLKAHKKIRNKKFGYNGYSAFSRDEDFQMLDDEINENE